MSAYYNEIDPFAAAWLRELIKKNLIAHGEVDERSIEDVRPEDLKGFTQCHFFAGVAVWSYALRQAGWPDDRPVWTGSCPCQPFSSAGKGKGFKDERHLWPEFYRLISQCRPATCFGEQVASKDGLAWVELVQANMESSDYAFGAVDTCAAGVGAPHIRQRIYWVADANSERRPWERVLLRPEERGERAGEIFKVTGCGKVSRVAHATSAGLERPARESVQRRKLRLTSDSKDCERPGPVNGHWRDADWLLCRDGKWRATQSIAIEMADGLADRLGYSRFGDRWSLNPLIQKAENRVGRLRGYGNAINAEQAKAFIKSYLEIEV